MALDPLIRRVERAELTMEAQQRQMAANLRQFRRGWRILWTPGRIVGVGLLSGFLTGRAAPVELALSGKRMVQLAGMLTSMFAGAAAKEAGKEASAKPPTTSPQA